MATQPWKKLLQPTRVSSLFRITPTITSHVSRMPACSRCTEDQLRARFEAWMIDYGVSYDTNSEKMKRFQVFKDRTIFIDLHNSTGDPSFTVGVNQFADWTPEEVSSSLC